MIILGIAFILFYFFSQNKFQAEIQKSQKKELEYQAKLLSNNIQIQERERERIARDLHDGIGSKLNVLKLSLHHLKEGGLNAQESDKMMIELDQLLQKTIDTTRNISHELLPPTLANFGLEAALEELVDGYKQASNWEIKYDYTALNSEQIPGDIALNLFRVTQEMLSNSFRYSSANLIQIKVIASQISIVLQYNDNGKGFNLSKEGQFKGSGLQNLEARMRHIQADFKLESEVGKGVNLYIKKDLL
ncbi:MAG: histidine kinase [Saprospiraceae bacterium]